MIISASRRTDIPAFYSQWFMDCIHRGSCTVKNPYNPNQIREISLLPEDVEAIVFWTRYPAPLLQYLDELDGRGYHSIFLFTITGYPQWLETHSPELSQSIKIFKTLSNTIGAQKVIWRYDPIVFSQELDFDFHINNFSAIASKLHHHTTRVIVSIMEPYRSVIKRITKHLGDRNIVLNPFEDYNAEQMEQFFSSLSTIAHERSMHLQSCCSELSLYGISNGACIDQQLLSNIFSIQLNVPGDAHQRKNCLCAKSVDIGAYNTCRSGCLYCYASR
ncbi:MAG: DUF1848 domain-containing protein [Spirochaetes bacterium]|nr:DUF1848 domain-containing protein [Spirochaetota bacterium]HPD05444.1 DUF1848 domain-containing protein [Spirochaetota bacterium]